MAESREQLTAAAIEGDTESLAQLLKGDDEALRARVRGAISRRNRASLEVDDVLQVTYLEAFLRIGHFVPNGADSLLNWLTKIAENNIRDAVRASGRAKRIPESNRVQPGCADDSYVSLLLQLGGSQTTPSSAVARSEAKRRLNSAIAQLPERYQKVVLLVDIDGHTSKEAGEIMQQTADAVRMMKARAHDRLAAILGSRSQYLSR